MELEGSRIVELSVWRVFSQLETVLSLLKESSHSLPGPVVGCLGAFLLFLKGLAISRSGHANLSWLGKSWGEREGETRLHGQPPNQQKNGLFRLCLLAHWTSTNYI
jgi:hypothetical protein